MHTSRNVKFYLGLTLIAGLSGCGGGDPAEDTAAGSHLMLAESTVRSAATMPMYCQNGIYPAQWEWNDNVPVRQHAAPATSGTPKIEQVRKGVVIATYSALGGDAGYAAENSQNGTDTHVGPFRRQPYLQWQPGDTFLIYPAVYRGKDMQIYLGPAAVNYAEFQKNNYVVPENITIRGVTVDGKRPVIVNPPSGASVSTYQNSLVYIEGKFARDVLVKPASNIVIENLDIVDAPDGGKIGRSAVYIAGVNNITIRDVRVSGFKLHSANGIFGAAGNSGTLTLENVELDSNGGGGGPEHNAYINSSSVDPHFTFHVKGSWSHDSFYGHELKSRAQRTIVEGSYLMGRRAAPGTQGEAYLLDVPNGGVLVARNNVFAKNYSGNNSNGASLTFGVESVTDRRPQELTVEHNTFVAFSKYFDDQKHTLYPLYIGNVATGSRNVSSNVFVGYCKANDAVKDYRGNNYVELGFGDIDKTFRPVNPLLGGNRAIIGSPQYSHRATAGQRSTIALGARD